jgi:hypothetical protein
MTIAGRPIGVVHSRFTASTGMPIPKPSMSR